MRGKRAEKRKLSGDPVYNSRLVHRFVNQLMKDGKKSIAQNILYKTFDKIKQEGVDPLEVFESAVRNVGPRMEVKPRRIGGASYQIPMELRGDRKEALSMRWIVKFARQRPSSEYRTMVDKLSAELKDAANDTGPSIKKRDDTHRMAEANKAFAHFRW